MRKRRPRLRTFDYVGRYASSLTFCTRDRCSAFTAPEIVAIVLEQILRAATQSDFAVNAYVFMPDHLHLLVSGTSDDSALLRFVSLAKQFAAYAYSRQRGERLWQPSFHDRVLRKDEDSFFVTRYIFDNPVRAGLVKRREDYPFMGSATMDRQEILRVLDELPSEAWQP